MARTFSYLMEESAVPRAEPIFAAVDRTISDTLDEVLDRAGVLRAGSIIAETAGAYTTGSGPAGLGHTSARDDSSLAGQRRVRGLLAATLGLGLDRVGAP
jgi:hypothetical protein